MSSGECSVLSLQRRALLPVRATSTVIMCSQRYLRCMQYSLIVNLWRFVEHLSYEFILKMFSPSFEREGMTSSCLVSQRKEVKASEKLKDAHLPSRHF